MAKWSDGRWKGDVMGALQKGAHSAETRKKDACSDGADSAEASMREVGSAEGWRDAHSGVWLDWSFAVWQGLAADGCQYAQYPVDSSSQSPGQKVWVLEGAAGSLTDTLNTRC